MVASPLNQVVCSTEVWNARMRDFLHDCAGSAPVEEPDRIREAILLLLHDPHTGAKRDFDPAAVEAMLSCGAPESAVLTLMGGCATFMLSRGTSGTCLATLVMADGSEEMICEAATLAGAAGAYVSMLLADSERIEKEVPPIGLSGGMRLH